MTKGKEDEVTEDNKKRTIHLTSDISDTDRSYKVVKLTNTTEYVPGQFLTREVVDDLCSDESWQVTVTAPK